MLDALRNGFLLEVEPGQLQTEGRSQISPVYQYIAMKESTEDEPPLHGATTLFELFERSVRSTPHEPIQSRRYITPSGAPEDCTYQTYREVELVVRRKVDLYHKLNITRGSRVGIYGQSAPEWLQTAIACDSIAAVSVPLAVDSSIAELQYIIRDAELAFVSVQDDYFESLVDAIESMNPEEHIDLVGVDVWSGRLDFEALDEAVTSRLIRKGIAVSMWGQPHGIIRSYYKTLPAPDDLCSVIYTRSSDGLRGVKLTHRSTLATVDALLKWRSCYEVGWKKEEKKMRMLSSIPVSSATGRVLEYMTMAKNGVICYSQGNGATLCENIAAFNPTFLAADGATLEVIQLSVMEYVKNLGFVFRCLYEKGIELRTRNQLKGLPAAVATMLDTTVFRQIRKHFRFKFDSCFVFDKTLETDLQDFVLSVISGTLTRSFGSTEMNGVITIGDCTMHRRGSWIGPVIPALEFRLIGSSTDDSNALIGELCVRGPTAFKGYLQFGKENGGEIAIDEGGFYNTKQIVEVLPDGSLALYTQTPSD